jgi:predicted dinucleotide-binding enzyme
MWRATGLRAIVRTAEIVAGAVDVPAAVDAIEDAAGAVDGLVVVDAIVVVAGRAGEDTNNFFATDLHGFTRIQKRSRR